MGHALLMAVLVLLFSATPAAADPATLAVIGSFALKVAVGIVISVALTFISQAIFGKPSLPEFDPFSQAGRTQQFRQPISPQRIIYGEERVSGP